ncbi:hypothetical protein [Mycolicibacterium llatzerense]|uniref:Beta-lactamase-related domain-containing protein n=1 Tax=Mycolicibacterium llatzerense TaxID=280871 RepID=A0A0D1LJB7_9MYCO|nr:hypothetical protein [Mycolicibacterium llatzerense]KIU18597.1 hypothetical protein TL10_01875 [Mycolicibacterium llatzerense]MCT7369369.1 hypothetical protein [Mycolicibacterium llatzerense]
MPRFSHAQWWLPAGDSGEFSAIGVYNQFVYVDPIKNTVIVKLSANRMYGTSDDESTNRELETVAFLRALHWRTSALTRVATANRTWQCLKRL